MIISPSGLVSAVEVSSVRSRANKCMHITQIHCSALVSRYPPFLGSLPLSSLLACFCLNPQRTHPYPTHPYPTHTQGFRLDFRDWRELGTPGAEALAPYPWVPSGVSTTMDSRIDLTTNPPQSHPTKGCGALAQTQRAKREARSIAPVFA